MTNYYFVLGAKDPEMDRIEELLIQHGCSYGYMFVDNPNDMNAYRRVHAGNAYVGEHTYEHSKSVEADTTPIYVFIECGFETGYTKPFERIDHHRPGDPGYDMGPDEFWEASSVGQLYKFLSLENPPEEDLLLAAMDHCLNAAMQGKCPDIDVDKLLEKKIADIGVAKEIPLAIVDGIIRHWKMVLPQLPVMNMNGTDVYMVPHTGYGYSPQYLCVQVVAVVQQVPILIELQNNPGEDMRYHLCGDVSPELVTYFLDEYVSDYGLTKPYGVPDRGYAGGHMSLDR